MELKLKSILGLVGGVVATLFLVITIFGSVEVNKDGYYVIRQSFRGEMSVISKPGPFLALWADTKTYPVVFEVYLSSSDHDGGTDSATQPIDVTFSDKTIATVSTVTKLRIPNDDELRLELHREFKSATALERYARSYIESVLITSGTFYKGTEAYSTERPAFEVTIRQQLVNGKYASYTEYEEEDTGEVDENGDPIIVKTPVTAIKMKDGQPVISDVGFFNTYGLEIRDFQLKAVQPDANTLTRINREKDIEQERRVSIQKAETAKQEAITAEAEGKAREAEAKAAENVAKITAVTRAEKERDVAVLDAERERRVAELNLEKERLNAEAVKVAASAEAERNKKLVSAGLSPEKRAEIDKEIAIGVAAELAKVKFPEMMILGGGSDGGALNPFDAVGLESFIKIQQEMSK